MQQNEGILLTKTPPLDTTVPDAATMDHR